MVRVRIAPSPTGFLHIGTARTALFNWLFAKKNKGEFILRIEDTDLERSEIKFEEDIISGLKWLGLGWDNQEIYRQSERLHVYAEYIQALLNSGKAFWCDHSKEELEAEQKRQSELKEAPRHICKHKTKRLKDGKVIRIAVDQNSSRKISFVDGVRGEIEWEEKLLGDFSLAKDLKIPLYNFAVVVDDIEMKISNVIRGEDHISNTPKQILIYEALHEKIPNFAHLPLILGADRSKLSKRHGATSVIEYRKDYLPEAIVNFMGFLGYTYNQEILTKEDMARNFEINKVHKSGAIFDVKKLNWINSQYVRKLSPEQFRKFADLSEASDASIPLITERLEKFSDSSAFKYLWQDPDDYSRGLLKWKNSSIEDSLDCLKKVQEIINNFDFDNNNKDDFRKLLNDFSDKVGDRGLVYWPLRVAVTGKEKSPDPVDIIYILGKEKTLDRVKKAITK